MTAPAGWYVDPDGLGGIRYCDGVRWTEQRIDRDGVQTAMSYVHPPVSSTREQKSAGLAALLTVLWPGAGHLYLGLNTKGMPYFVINAVALALWLILWVFIPLGVVVWVVTLCMTIGSIADDTRMVNGQ
jgi:hypothetical protein